MWTAWSERHLLQAPGGAQGRVEAGAPEQNAQGDSQHGPGGVPNSILLSHANTKHRWSESSVAVFGAFLFRATSQILLRWRSHPERVSSIKGMSNSELSRRRLKVRHSLPEEPAPSDAAASAAADPNGADAAEAETRDAEEVD